MNYILAFSLKSGIEQCNVNLKREMLSLVRGLEENIAFELEI